MKRNITIYTLLCVLFLGTLSCKDDMPYGYGEIGEGECMISGTVKFKSFTPALSVNTRAAGEAIKEINSLCVLLYKEDQTLQGKYPLTPGTEAGEGVFVVNKNVPRTNGTGSAGETGEIAESSTPQAKFQLTIPYGKYHIYAVANMDLSGSEDAIQTVEGLKSISLQWKEDDVSKNCQMFGHFFSASNTDEAPLLVINRATQKLQAWVRRAASKVTVAFDGTRLADGVSIYIKSVAIKDIPTMCYLGKDSKIVKEAENTADNYGDLIADGESLAYGTGEAHNAWPTITNTASYCYYDKDNKKGTVVAGYDSSQEAKYAAKAHDEYNDALFFYENMQGEGMDKSQKDEDGDGKPDSKPEKDGKPYGTYIEVEAYYNSENPECLGSGDIKYRFMLGKNTTTNYDAERNHHYKLTLIFNRFANDPDWHIYKERYFGVTQPKDVNYKGEFFTPTNDIPNLGYDFNTRNTVTVTSFEENIETKEKNKLEWQISYRDLSKGETDFSATECSWLKCDIGELNENFEQEVTFVADTNYIEVDIDANLKSAPEKGSSSAPHNLANQGGKTNGYGIECTANCYMIGAPGWYQLPLVYGNALHDGGTNSSSYQYTGTTGDNILSTFRNHLDKEITDPYINNNEGCTAKEASLVWQDEQNLVTDISYDASLYGEMGGIKFQVSQANIQQGNAIIAVKDNNGTVMWSWHIWVTRFDFEKTITVTGHDEFRKFELMPVNLGWCSDHGAKIKYYKSRECEIKFTAGSMEKTVKIKQYPHTALPRGNNPYYQWRRKDPFIGTNINYGNKPRWDGYGTFYDIYAINNPPRLTRDRNDSGITTEEYDYLRLTTRNALGQLIQKPDTWHNPPRKKVGTNPDGTPKYASDNLTYINLWQGRPRLDPNAPTRKTVYDPCPVGYQVSHVNAFTGFTVSGDNQENGATDYWFHVRKEDIPDENPKDALFEFYTDKGKLQSIIFPETGYRDWDSFAGIYQFEAIGYIWAAGNYNNEDNNSYNFEFSRTDQGGYVRPKNFFYPCDGFPIRPSVYEKHGTE